MVQTLNNFLLLSALIFCIGLFGALSRKNAVAILMSLELMLNAVNIALVAFARYVGPADVIGQVFTLFVITVAAAEAALGLAIVVAVYRTRRTVSVEDVNLLKG
jgi:NAD(P)H-quinone oxidoreductase subunit 4L